MFREFIIYSVFRKEDLDTVNSTRHNSERSFLRNMGIQFIEASGVYQGTNERSLVVPREFSNIVKERAWNARQECVLVVNASRMALLAFQDGSKYIGTWNEVTDEYAGDHTIINGIKYAVKG